MAKVKLTKTALKQQRDSLKQYLRFLPTLQLKKQQLQMEIRASLERIRANEEKERAAVDDLRSWLRIFGDDTVPETIVSLLSIRAIHAGSLNIAGVEVPVFDRVDFEAKPYDLFRAEPWLDDAIVAVQQIVSIRMERAVLHEQTRLIRHELHVTTQRVNLFEKVKIPEAKENIRVIQISISDAAIASVARSKIAKKKLQETAA